MHERRVSRYRVSDEELMKCALHPVAEHHALNPALKLCVTRRVSPIYDCSVPFSLIMSSIQTTHVSDATEDHRAANGAP